jgi:hypothetical protein
MTDPERPTLRGSRAPLVLGLATLAVLLGAGWWFFLRGDEAGGDKSRGFGDYAFDDPGRIYLGRPPLVKNPAVVDSSRVYAQIPEYQQIVREKISEGGPQYHFLMLEASKRFKEAVGVAARAAGHDLVAETGTVHAKRPGAPDPPDLTAAVLQALR